MLEAKMADLDNAVDSTPQDRTRQIVVLVVILVATIAANVLGAFMGQTDTGDIANQQFGDSVYFFPATYVFGTIWPVIYLGIVGLAVHQALRTQRTNPRYRRGMVLLTINLVLNAGWVAIFGARLYALSLVTIVPILVTAIIAYDRLAVGRSPQVGIENLWKTSVGIYTAWLTIATVANVSLVLADAGWSGLGLTPVEWGLTITIAGIVLGVLFLLLFKDASFPAVYAYAYLGIMVRQRGVVPSIATTALIGTAIFALLVLYLIGRRVRTPRPLRSR
jgi:tryptophan-rich sensory protein